MSMRCLVCCTRQTNPNWNVCDTCIKSIIHHYEQQNPALIEVRWLDE